MIDPGQIGVGVGAIVMGAVYAAKRLGWLQDRQPALEPRAEELWRSEAEAQRARAGRLENELREVNRKLDSAITKMATMEDEIKHLRSRPDYHLLLSRLEEHDTRMMELSGAIASTLSRIAQAVIPPERILGE